MAHIISLRCASEFYIVLCYPFILFTAGHINFNIPTQLRVLATALVYQKSRVGIKSTMITINRLVM